MKERITPLPHWCLTDLHPAFYDTESVTAIEMVAKLYSKMEYLIEDYNIYIDKINKYVQEFEDGIIKDFAEFKACITKTMNDYIATIDMKINIQDSNIANKFDEIDAIVNNQNSEIASQNTAIENQNQTIQNAVNYMQTNLTETITNLINYYFEQGELTSTVSVSYDEPTERIDILDTLVHAESEEY